MEFKSVTRLIGSIFVLTCFSCQLSPSSGKLTVGVEQITSGPANHFFGYIGHVQNIPWNASGRYLLALRVAFNDRMPRVHDVADIVLLDSHNGYTLLKVEETRAWNPQQGTMLYWNPDRPHTQFFFNDRDSQSNHIFGVLFDIEEGRRIHEYRFADTPVGNGGVRQNGGSFLAINYGRMARLRPVTGYPEAYDWTGNVVHPKDDGVFKVDVQSGTKELLVSFRQLRDLLLERHPQVAETPLFINHTLWNREGDRIFFFVRGNFSDRDRRVNIPMTMRSDGTELREQHVFIGGHPEWEQGPNLIGHVDGRLVVYDSDRQKVIGPVGPPKAFPDPENDVALSPDGAWVVQGLEEGSRTAYTVFRRSDGVWTRTKWFDQKEFTTGPLRIDAAPKWNRSSDEILFSSLTEELPPTRQLYLIRIGR